MKRTIITTADGSHTLFVPEMNEHFHSVHGAVQESMHVFITSGLEKTTLPELVVFEVGFGTGLNALLTCVYRQNRRIRYYAIERYPLLPAEFDALNYSEYIADDTHTLLATMHRCDWNRPVEIAPGFELCKLEGDLTAFDLRALPPFDLIYFDAFAPDKQPELWEEPVFARLSAGTKPGGIIVTYCAKGEVRRRMMRSGFAMKRLPGPPGKKEMLFGQKVE